MHKYRTHTTREILEGKHTNDIVRLSGWINNLERLSDDCFTISLKEHYGVINCTIDKHNYNCWRLLDSLCLHCAITVTGRAKAKDNKSYIEVDKLVILSTSKSLPNLTVELNSNPEKDDEYRFLSLRQQELHQNIVTRANIIDYIRSYLNKKSFVEVQTPILSVESPEGAKSFLVENPAQENVNYSLPQSPQVYKQLLMVSGFDRYYQVAPCFRYKQGHPSRTLYEFYQLDMEMCFVEQQEIIELAEKFIMSIFEKYGDKKFNRPPFPRVTYEQSMLISNSDKPDLRNFVNVVDVTNEIIQSENKQLLTLIEEKYLTILKALHANEISESTISKLGEIVELDLIKTVSYNDNNFYFYSDYNLLIDTTTTQVMTSELVKACSKVEQGLGIIGNQTYLIFLESQQLENIIVKVRDTLADEFATFDESEHAFCWVTDFPLFKLNNESSLAFNHNPFSMPTGCINDNIDTMTQEELLKATSSQIDLVCNGIELASGAMRIHDHDFLLKILNKIGLEREAYKEILSAYDFAPPPHGGIAFGIERLLMLLMNQTHVRDIVAFPKGPQYNKNL